jgi:hypothetical protein
MKYSVDMIKVDKFPKVKKLPNGKKEQNWEIVLKQTLTKQVNLQDISQKLSHKDFQVTINAKEGKYLNVCVITVIDPNPYSHDYTIFDIYKMFDDIEELLGSIDTIQGQKREERWEYLRKQKKSKNS